METEIKVKIEKKTKCKIEVDIEVSSDIVKEASKQALKDIKKEITLPGFRKGKAPDSAVLKKYPDSYKESFEKKIADISFIKAHEKEKLPSLTQESKIVFKIKEYSLEKGATVHYSYETEPDVPKIDPTAFKISKDSKIDVTKKEIDEAIRQIRFFHAEWKDADRPIKENDYIIIDLDSIESDTPQRVFSDTRFEVSDKGMASWMKELVLGKKLNDSLKGTSKPDEKATAEEKKNFEPKKVLVTIKKIEEALKNYKSGDIVEIEVTGIADFGVFIKFIGNKEKDESKTGKTGETLEGLIHISELSWQLINNPSELVAIGQKLKAKIINISNNKVSLSLKALEKDLWENIEEKYKKGDIVKGKVTKFNPFGAFIEIEPKIQGLCHISEFGSVKKMEETLKLEKEYKFQIYLIEPSKHRMSLKLTETE